MKTLSNISGVLFWVFILIGFIICSIILSPILIIDYIKSRKKLLIIGFILTLPSVYAGHFTKFTNSGTIFRTGESRSVQFIDKTQDMFGKPLQNMKYEWAFGDGQTSSESNPIHQYNSWGLFDIKLTVTDTSINFSNSYSKRINIERFKDTCSVIINDTIKEIIFTEEVDTTFIIHIDTTKITVIDTIYVVSNKEIKEGEGQEARVFDINGRFVNYMMNFDPYLLPKGEFIILLFDGKNYKTKKIIKK